ncbi:MAG: alpha/beta fold hydrolase [Nannocystales bacterium]
MDVFETYSSIESAPCLANITGAEQECFTLTVPADWDNPSLEATVEIHATVVRTSQTPQDTTPVVYLPGGPGGDLPTDLTDGAEFINLLVSERPFVFFTPRGTVGSLPSLECPDIEADSELLGGAACIAELRAAGQDLSVFTSMQSRHDVEALRRNLEYERWHVLGESYGTVLAQLVMDSYPEGIESVVLASVAKLDPASFFSFAKNIRSQVEAYFEACEADAMCTAAYPEFRTRFLALLSTLDEDPLQLPLPQGQFVPGPDGELVNYVTLDASWLVYTAAGELALSAETIGFMPRLVDELERGDTTTAAEVPAADIYPEPQPGEPSIAGAVRGTLDAGGFILQCNDTFSALSASGVVPNLDDPVEAALADLPGTSYEEWAAVCDELADGGGLSIPAAPVESSLPTLLLGGAFDDATPAHFADVVASRLSRETIVVSPTSAHGVLFTECGLTAALTHFREPGAVAAEACDSDGPITWH